MKKIIDFVKNNIWIWIVVALIVAVVGDALLQNAKNAPSATPTPAPRVASYNNVVPGVSTEAELNKVLGTPVRTTISGSQRTDEYKSTSELRTHLAVIENGKVAFIKEVVSAHDTTTASDISGIYGTAPNILYSKFPNSSFNLYVYPASGTAYLGHTDGTLLEIWYFQPTTIENFLTAWASDYSLNPSTEILQ